MVVEVDVDVEDEKGVLGEWEEEASVEVGSEEAGAKSAERDVCIDVTPPVALVDADVCIEVVDVE